MPETPTTVAARPKLDQSISDLQSAKSTWACLPLSDKIRYGESLFRGFERTARGQVEAACAAKGVPFDSHFAGEDWIGGPYIQLRTLRILLDSLRQIRDGGAVKLPASAVRERPDGQLTVRVFPLSALDRLLYGGFSADVWLDRSVTRDNLPDHVGASVRNPDPAGAVGLVLGAGNVASIGALDVVHKLFVEGQVTLLKFNPVNEYLGPFVEDAFGDLIAEGFMRTAYGGADVGDYLCHHPGIEAIHITGSDRTHDAIVFGTGPEGTARKARGESRLGKPITSELGNVSPIVLVPGEWSASDLRFQAQNVATQMTQNGGFNCNAAKVLVTHAAWPQREAFLGELRAVLSSLPPRPAYYPGAEERYDDFLSRLADAHVLGERRPGVLPPALATGLDAADANQQAFRSESFCALTVETPLEAAGAAQFLERAVDLCNDSLAGTLNAELILHPATERAHKDELDAAVAALRYGTVGINQWPAMGFALGSTPWGAYPGATLTDIQSGIGFVHNALLLDRPEKSFVRGPFRVFPKPTWFVTHRNSHRVGERLVALEADPGFRHVPGILFHALRG